MGPLVNKEVSARTTREKDIFKIWKVKGFHNKNYEMNKLSYTTNTPTYAQFNQL